MSVRKDKLKALFANDVADEPITTSQANKEPDSTEPPLPNAVEPKRASSGAVRAMGLSLGSIAEGFEGERVQQLDAEMIDGAFVSDRLSKGGQGDETFTALVESMRDAGQQVPILVRPHPDKEKEALGWYQCAYGHRRVQAARLLDLPVNAIVRPLSDEELVLAQGRENNERRDLSFIERSFFARGLIDHGFDRATVQTALGVHKTEMTRLLQVAERIPRNIASAIGPASKIGRPRWLALGDLLAKAGALTLVDQEIRRNAFQAADSNARFALLFKCLSDVEEENEDRTPLPVKAVLRSGETAVLAVLKTTARGDSTLAFSKQAPPGFDAFLAGSIPDLLKDFYAEIHGDEPDG